MRTFARDPRERWLMLPLLAVVNAGAAAILLPMTGNLALQGSPFSLVPAAVFAFIVAESLSRFRQFDQVQGRIEGAYLELWLPRHGSLTLHRDEIVAIRPKLDRNGRWRSAVLVSTSGRSYHVKGLLGLESIATWASATALVG